jgi:hypothetical protein
MSTSDGSVAAARAAAFDGAPDAVELRPTLGELVLGEVWEGLDVVDEGDETW